MEFIIVGLVLAFAAFGLYHVLGDWVGAIRKGYKQGKVEREARERRAPSQIEQAQLCDSCLGPLDEEREMGVIDHRGRMIGTACSSRCYDEILDRSRSRKDG